MDFNVVLRNMEGKAKLVSKEEKGILDILGIEVKEVDHATARKLDIDGGLKVTRMTQGLLRKSTDMRPGFIITKVDGKDPGSREQFIKYLSKVQGGVMLEGVYEDYPGTYYYAFGM
jgi:serine protease Do